MAKLNDSAKNTGAVTSNAVVFSEQLPTGYTVDSLANATLSVAGTNQTLTTVAVTQTADNQVRYDDVTGTITIYVGDVAATEEVAITFTAIVE